MNLPRKLLPIHTLAAAAIAAIIPSSLGAPPPGGGLSLLSLYAFTTNATPAASLVEGTNGNFYGTTLGGGAYGKGSIFLVTPAGFFTNLVSFDGTNGAAPTAPLYLDANGYFYGTTSSGGSTNQGTFFAMSHEGVFTSLVRFGGTNGANPMGGLVSGPKGLLYGTTVAGGANSNGTIFIWSPATGVSNVFSFSGTNGSAPEAGLVLDRDGNLYGTTYLGGTNGLGTVFQFIPSNSLMTTLISFSLTNGAFPGGLVEVPNGLMYGTTFAGGTNNFGSVFAVTTNGTFTTLASFGFANGSNPEAPVVLGADGFLYGTTVQGGTDGKGVIFRLSTNFASGGGRGFGQGGFGGTGTSTAVLTNLVSFSGVNGAYPEGGLIQAADGNFYGTTASGGANGFGNIFELSGFPPSITQQPASQNFVSAGTASFMVAALGSTPLGFQWEFDGNNLVDGTNVINGVTNVILGSTSNNLTIAREVLNNAGSYFVVVTNAFGSATSTVVTLAVAAPTLTIKSPGLSVTNVALTVQGTAADKYGLSAVEYQFNTTNGWSLASTTNQWTNWSVMVSLQTGTNTFRAYSVDPLGNTSTTNSVTVFYVTHSVLTLLTNGFGTISRGFTGTNLVVGTNYTVTAVPKANNLFSNWTGTITATNNPLKFLMVSNMTLTANFVTNSFLRTAGIYNGLFYVPGAVGTETSGLLGSLTVGTLGAYSGRLYLGGSNYVVSGNFDLAGDASNQVTRTRDLGPLTLLMHLDWNITPPQITGTVAGTNGGAWTAALTNELAGSKLPSVQYTMLIPPGPGAPAASPGGDGYALITDHLGTASVIGALADGASYSQVIAESENLRLAFYATPYTNGGLLLGWLDMSGGAPAGSLTWIRPTAASGLFTNGYTNFVTVQSSTWTDLGAKIGTTFLPNGGQLDFSGGFLAGPLDFNVTLATSGALLKQGVNPTNSLTGVLNLKYGFLSMAFGNGNGRQTTAGVGVILQNLNTAGGFFTTTTNAGAITLTPNP